MSDVLTKMLDKHGSFKLIDLSTLNLEGEAMVEEIESIEILGGAKFNKKFGLGPIFSLKIFPAFENCIAYVEDIVDWKHLQNIDYTNTYKDQVLLVIGLSHPHLLRPVEVRSAADHEPYAVRTELGWTVNGPVKSIKDNVT